MESVIIFIDTDSDRLAGRINEWIMKASKDLEKTLQITRALQSQSCTHTGITFITITLFYKLKY